MARPLQLLKSYSGRAGLAFPLVVAWSLSGSLPALAETPTPAVSKVDGVLVYARGERGDRIPDFSTCGYAGGHREPPEVAVRAVLSPADGDDGLRIQAAIDFVSELPIAADGLRGGVMLGPGEFQVAGQLRIGASGVVLRGASAGPGGTTITAIGQDRRTLVRIAGDKEATSSSPSRRVRDGYIPVGAVELRLDSAASLKVGDRVIITRSSTAEWIAELEADAFGVGWRPGSRDLRWDRTIVSVDGDAITVDAPITTAIDARFGGATVQAYDWRSRIENVGVEDLCLISAYDAVNLHDEEHSWFGVTIDNVRDAWVRNVEFRHFAGGAVAAWNGTSRVTVTDCTSLEPVSENAGYRRHAFSTAGQQNLFLRCWSEKGRRDFSVGHCAAGPNAFVHCRTSGSLADSGPAESWAAGVLFDNVRIDGAGLALENRWASPGGAGWSAANCVLWQCQAATMRVFQPPTAQNWAIGIWAVFAGDGHFEGRSEFVEPASLYQAQLRERLGDAAAQRVDPLPSQLESTNPSLEEAAAFAADSKAPARTLLHAIQERQQAATERRLAQWNEVQSIGEFQPPAAEPKENERRVGAQQLTLANGWLTIDGRVAMGKHFSPKWWSGNARPNEAATFGPAVTRFVPGRDGIGLTDDLVETAEWMATHKVAVLDHHYGLWYDRRRDDHLMVRRSDGDCYPPFYEQPFARTGRGQAWDGLSKYDLTRFNPWYWSRLRDFAKHCDDRGLTLFHQNYFQHNILEAGAHWADSPWRSANNVNEPGFPEPPPYVGDKRIFMASQFYDVGDPRRRELHRRYIRQCLDNFADCSNVVQLTSGEYSGPLAFTQFWLDTVAEWEREKDVDVLTALSAPKDVQDAILEDTQRAPHVELIDIRYWAYTADDGLYAPGGGLNLAPRQHLRQTRLESGGFAAIVKAVREYRMKHPDKAVTYFADLHCPSARDGWAVLMGGGSFADVAMPTELAQTIPRMQPVDGVVDGADQSCLATDDGELLIYASVGQGAAVKVNLPSVDTDYAVTWIDVQTGEATAGERIRGLQNTLALESPAAWLRPLARE